MIDGYCKAAHSPFERISIERRSSMVLWDSISLTHMCQKVSFVRSTPTLLHSRVQSIVLMVVIFWRRRSTF